MMAFFAQMEDAIIIMRAVVLVSGQIHWYHVDVVIVIQDVKITAMIKLVHLFKLYFIFIKHIYSDANAFVP